MNELELLRKELERLRRRVEELERINRERDLELRDGLLLTVRGIERRQGIGKYSPIDTSRAELTREV